MSGVKLVLTPITQIYKVDNLNKIIKEGHLIDSFVIKPKNVMADQ